LTVDYQYAYASTYWAVHRVLDQYGCLSDSVGVLVTIDSFPRLEAGSDRYILKGDSAVLNTSISGDIIGYNWVPNVYLNNNTIPAPVCVPQHDTTYLVSVTGRGGCTAYDSLNIIVLPRDLGIPNAFSPNGDGKHDTWDIPLLRKFPGATLKVFNRYGQEVYSSNGYANYWDGTSSGQKLPVGVYYYIISPKNGLKDLSGSISIFW